MQIKAFLETLPTLYRDWGSNSMQPIGESFDDILEQVNQPTTPNFLTLLTAASKYLDTKETICEIGCLAGANLISVLVNNPNCLAYGVDFFSTQSEIAEQKIEELQANLDKFGVLEQVCFSHNTIDEFFTDLKDIESADKFGLYVYNFEPDYRQVFMSLLLARDFLSEQALIIVNNTNLGQVRQAVADFLTTEPSAKIILDWQAVGNKVLGSKGLGLIAWDTQNNLGNLQPLIIQEIEPTIPLQSTKNTEHKKKVLHVGCGPYNPEALPPELRTEEWQEIRLDIDPQMNPDILGTITDLSAVEDNFVDAVYSSHNLEHIYDYEVPIALAEFKRVLKPGGLVWLVVPDMQIAAEWVVKGDMDDQPLYFSPAGPVKALWMFYGMGTSIPGIPYMAHKTGFTASSLSQRLMETGFISIDMSRGNFNIYAKSYKAIK